MLSDAGRSIGHRWVFDLNEAYGSDRCDAGAVDYGFRFVPARELSSRLCGAASFRPVVLGCAFRCLQEFLFRRLVALGRG